MPASPPGDILVVGPSWVGDMVMSQGLFRLIKQDSPDTSIDVLAPPWSLPILERMPEVRTGIEMPTSHGELGLGKRLNLGRSLRGRYQQAIVLPNSLKSALVPAFAQIPLRTGWRGEMRFGLLNDIRLLNKKRLPLMLQRFVALGRDCQASLPDPLPIPQLMTDANNLDQLINRLGLKLDKPVLALCPGAEFGDAKQWPARHYTDIAEARIKDGGDVWILGSDADTETGNAIRSALDPALQPSCRVLAGKTRLVDAIDLLGASSAVVTNDSGLMHIAAATGTPLVAVYGSTSPEFTPPLGEKVRIVTSSLDCAPCFKRTCPLQHKNCLEQQMPDVILRNLAQLT
jgi:heptosyltransferase-2